MLDDDDDVLDVSTEVLREDEDGFSDLERVLEEELNMDADVDSESSVSEED